MVWIVEICHRKGNPTIFALRRLNWILLNWPLIFPQKFGFFAKTKFSQSFAGNFSIFFFGFRCKWNLEKVLYFQIQPPELKMSPSSWWQTFVHINQNPTNLGSERGNFTKVNVSISAGALRLRGGVVVALAWFFLRLRAVARRRGRYWLLQGYVHIHLSIHTDSTLYSCDTTSTLSMQTCLLLGSN